MFTKSLNTFMAAAVFTSFISLPVLASTPEAAEHYQLTFSMTEVKAKQGKMYVALFKGAENYQKNNAQASTIVTVDGDEVVVTFDELPQGDYAVRYFHDENGNNKLDLNLFGSPIEGIGFSNDAKPSYGPVGFEAAKFTVTSDVINSSSVIYSK